MSFLFLTPTIAEWKKSQLLILLLSPLKLLALFLVELVCVIGVDHWMFGLSFSFFSLHLSENGEFSRENHIPPSLSRVSAPFSDYAFSGFILSLIFFSFSLYSTLIQLLTLHSKMLLSPLLHHPHPQCPLLLLSLMTQRGWGVWWGVGWVIWKGLGGQIAN